MTSAASMRKRNGFVELSILFPLLAASSFEGFSMIPSSSKMSAIPSRGSAIPYWTTSSGGTSSNAMAASAFFSSNCSIKRSTIRDFACSPIIESPNATTITQRRKTDHRPVNGRSGWHGPNQAVGAGGYRNIRPPLFQNRVR